MCLLNSRKNSLLFTSFLNGDQLLKERLCSYGRQHYGGVCCPGKHRKSQIFFPLQKKKGGKMEVYPSIITLLHLERPKLYIEFLPFLVQWNIPYLSGYKTGFLFL